MVGALNKIIFQMQTYSELENEYIQKITERVRKIYSLTSIYMLESEQLKNITLILDTVVESLDEYI